MVYSTVRCMKNTPANLYIKANNMHRVLSTIEHSENQSEPILQSPSSHQTFLEPRLPVRTVWSLMMVSVWRTSNIMIARYFKRPPRYLPILLLFVTDRCNLRCRMCGVCNRANSSQGDELTTEEYHRLLSSAAQKLGTTLISISGGEPLLRNDIFDIIRFATEAGLAVHICTNGVLLTTERAMKLREAGVAAVSISLDSPDASQHDFLRGQGTFASTVEAIALLRKTAPKIQVGINYLITRLNYHCMNEMVDLAETLDVQQIKFAPIHTNLLHRFKAKSEFEELYFTPDELDDLQKAITGLKKRIKKCSLSTTSAAFYDGIVPFYRAPRPFTCYAGYAVCAIGPYGNVTPCCDMDSPFSVKDRPLEEIWQDPAFHVLRLRAVHCSTPCWDTTNTELSLRLHPLTLIKNIAANWRDLRFYSGKERR